MAFQHSIRSVGMDRSFANVFLNFFSLVLCFSFLIVISMLSDDAYIEWSTNEEEQKIAFGSFTNAHTQTNIQTQFDESFLIASTMQTNTQWLCWTFMWTHYKRIKCIWTQHLGSLQRRGNFIRFILEWNFGIWIIWSSLFEHLNCYSRNLWLHAHISMCKVNKNTNYTIKLNAIIVLDANGNGNRVKKLNPNANDQMSNVPLIESMMMVMVWHGVVPIK